MRPTSRAAAWRRSTLDVDAGHRQGLLAFAPAHEAHGQMFSARRRLHVTGEEAAPPPVTEDELYGSP